MSDMRVLYPPTDTLKPVADNLWIVDSGPVKPFGLALPVRMTVVQLADDSLLLHSPTRVTDALQAELEAIGDVAHLVAPSSGHWLHVQEWQKRFPRALAWATPGLRNRIPVRRSGVRFDRDLSAGIEGWPREIEQILVPGIGGFAETAMFHHASRTLLLADLVQNLQANRLQWLARPLAKLAGVTAPRGRAPVYLRAIVRAKGEVAREAARRLVDLNPERVIFAHGAWFDRDATARLRQALGWLL
ncbi:DUF4336 domain-containing protein [Aurantimonas sp. A2-1-M11]|uniref:DUF4336 domain-containing protein n=1 Tax=Aurantimonas sp. A2-1-M11 TaxID=3113712 RepID=UPI002F92BFA4